MTKIKQTMKTDERGEGPAPIQASPIFVWPIRPITMLKFFFGHPGYFLPMNILYMGLAIVSWFWLAPDLASMKTFQWDWIAII